MLQLRDSGRFARSARRRRTTPGATLHWPPPRAARFVHSGNWVLLDGFSGGTAKPVTQPVRVTWERIGDSSCQNLRDQLGRWPAALRAVNDPDGRLLPGRDRHHPQHRHRQDRYTSATASSGVRRGHATTPTARRSASPSTRPGGTTTVTRSASGWSARSTGAAVSVRRSLTARPTQLPGRRRRPLLLDLVTGALHAGARPGHAATSLHDLSVDEVTSSVTRACRWKDSERVGARVVAAEADSFRR